MCLDLGVFEKSLSLAIACHMHAAGEMQLTLSMSIVVPGLPDIMFTTDNCSTALTCSHALLSSAATITISCSCLDYVIHSRAWTPSYDT